MRVRLRYIRPLFLKADFSGGGAENELCIGDGVQDRFVFQHVQDRLHGALAHFKKVLLYGRERRVMRFGGH